jgi:hypothetical protein
MNKLASFLLNGLLLSLFLGILMLPAVSMGIANIAPTKTEVLSAQDAQPVKPAPKRIIRPVKKVIETTIQATQSTETQLDR